MNLFTSDKSWLKNYSSRKIRKKNYLRSIFSGIPLSPIKTIHRYTQLDSIGDGHVMGTPLLPYNSVTRCYYVFNSRVLLFGSYYVKKKIISNTNYCQTHVQKFDSSHVDDTSTQVYYWYK